MNRVDDMNFSEFIGKGPAVIMFTSPWCAACKHVGAVLEVLIDQWKGQASFGTCDISTSTALASRLEVLSLPTIIIFKSGKAVKRLTGSLSENTLSNALKEAL